MSEMHEHAKRRVVSAEGMKKLEEKLEYLTGTRRAEVAEKLNVARGYGDLSENAEYDAAKNEQATLESEIAELEATIRTAIVLSDENISTDRVNVGVHVRVRYLDDDSEEEYALVGALESDPMANRISNECPIGAALLGKQVGDLVDVEAPDGVIKLEVLEITRPD
ncbi:MAG: transcription elongation factor GreA [Clostridiales bacterium]|nr:transcription elongation factor GreA [Clostridiales bacterium]